MHTIRSLVPAVAKLPFVLFGKGWLALKIRAGQIVEQHIELGVEQILPTLRQVIEQRRLVFQKKIVALIELVNVHQTQIFSQQIRQRALLKPLPVQPPFAARIDQPIRAEALQY